MRAEGARRAFTVAEYHRMGEAGILHEDDRVELIDGVIVQMSPIGSRHAACVDRLAAVLMRALGERAIVRVQNPVTIGRLSEPQPDLMVLKPRDDFYAARHPGPSDVLLLIEVTDTTGVYDRATKLPLYARSGIVEAWVVDVRRHVIEVYRGPTLRGYRTRRDVPRGRHIVPAATPRMRVAVDALVGPTSPGSGSRPRPRP
jgi:Uma2 family endonuclease